jgi:hypothetical protein
VKAEVVLPDRKYAKLWSGMRHEESPVNCGSKWETLVVLRTVVGFYLFMNYVLLSQKSHVEFFLAHILSLSVTLPLGGCKRLLIIKPSYKP